MATRRTADQIIDAVASAATDLLIARCPSAVSMRDIAAAADVNLGLIHRYVGSKDDVIALVLRRHTERARSALEVVADSTDLFDLIATAVVDNPTSGPLLSGLLHEGVDISSLKTDFPLLDHLTEERDPVQASLTYALALGWEIFGPSLLAASGDPEADPAEVKSRLAIALGATAAANP